jgi:hypothetical protein
MIELFALMVAGHALADYPLQGDFLAKAKNHAAPIPGVPFYQALGAHSAIHAGFVGVITGSIWLALAEFTIHTATDYAKCDGRISYNTDQAIHIGCKVAWAALASLSF